MRKSLIAMAVLGLSAALIATPASAVTTTMTTLALWNMNEAPGSTVLVDDSGNGVNGTIGAHVTLNGSSHTFPYHNGSGNGTGTVDPAHLDLVTVKASLVPGLRNYVVTVRFAITGAPFGNLINFGQSGGAGMVKVQVDGLGGRIGCQFVGFSGSGAVSSRTKVNDGKFHTVVCTRTATQVSMTLDGVAVGHINHVTGMIVPTLPFSIGGKSKCDAKTVSCDYFAGQIDYVEVQTF